MSVYYFLGNKRQLGFRAFLFFVCFEMAPGNRWRNSVLVNSEIFNTEFDIVVIVYIDYLNPFSGVHALIGVIPLKFLDLKKS